MDEFLPWIFVLGLGALITFGVGSCVYCASPSKKLNIESRCYSAEFVKQTKCNENPNLEYCKSIFTEKKE